MGERTRIQMKATRKQLSPTQFQVFNFLAQRNVVLPTTMAQQDDTCLRNSVTKVGKLLRDLKLHEIGSSITRGSVNNSNYKTQLDTEDSSIAHHQKLTGGLRMLIKFDHERAQTSIRHRIGESMVQQQQRHVRNIPVTPFTDANHPVQNFNDELSSSFSQHHLVFNNFTNQSCNYQTILDHKQQQVFANSEIVKTATATATTSKILPTTNNNSEQHAKNVNNQQNYLEYIELDSARASLKALLVVAAGLIQTDTSFGSLTLADKTSGSCPLYDFVDRHTFLDRATIAESSEDYLN